MYAIQFRQTSDKPTKNLVSGILTLAEAKQSRYVSGDLVVHQSTNQIVKEYDWLWDWEKADTNCYAQQAIRSSK